MATDVEVRVETRGMWRLKLCLFMLRIVVVVMDVVNRARFRKDERPGTVILDLTIGGRAHAESNGSMPA